jgi:hypothetical protein
MVHADVWPPKLLHGSAIPRRNDGCTHLRNIPLTQAASRERTLPAGYKIPAVAKHKTKKSQHSAHFNPAFPSSVRQICRPRTKNGMNTKKIRLRSTSPTSRFGDVSFLGRLNNRNPLSELLPFAGHLVNNAMLSSFGCSLSSPFHSLLYRLRGRTMSVTRAVAITGSCLQPKLCK